MASLRPSYYEQELEEDINDGTLDIAIGTYGQNTYDTDQPQLSEAALQYIQQEIAQQSALAQIPDAVKRFIVHFHAAVTNNNIQEISVAYESGWNRLTEKFYAKAEWPEAEIIAPLVDNDPIFLVLYRELYYRHVYSRLSPNVDDRFHSYENSCELFNYLLNSDGPVQLALPDIWLWDIIDEFIYQFQSFCVWRSRVKNKTEEEIEMLAESGGQIWSCYSVLNVLYSLIQKSRINEYLDAIQDGKSPEEIEHINGEYGGKPLYRSLGYFSIIGLLRVHVLLGDYTLALKVMDRIELNQKSFFTRVTACHVATYYYVGFCYLALRRYPDAVRTFSSILNFISRMRQYHTKSYQYDQINKTGDRMYALLAMCHALSPSRLDDNILSVVRERWGEQFTKMQRGVEGLQAFEELFIYSCPKFIAANPPPYHDPELLALYASEPPVDPAQRHCALFLTDVRTLLSVPTLRSFLKLYKSLDTKRLAGLFTADPEKERPESDIPVDAEEELVQQMMVLKLACRSISRPEGPSNVPVPGGHLGGNVVSTSDLDFAIDDNMIYIVESTIGRRFAGWFIRNTEHTQRVLDNIVSTPLPLPKPVPEPAAAPTNAIATNPQPTAPAKKTVAWGGAGLKA